MQKNNKKLNEVEQMALALQKIEYERQEFQRIKNMLDMQEMEDRLYDDDDESDEEEFQTYEDEYTRAYEMMREFAS